jgi:ankyrin repeat protein
VNVADSDGTTPLHVAARSGDRRLIDVLVAAGANREARDDNGGTPADVAEAAVRLLVAPSGS